MRKVWLTNVPNPKSTPSKVTFSSDISSEQDDSLLQEWLSGKVLGEPKPTDGRSLDQLKAQGYVGVYKYV